MNIVRQARYSRRGQVVRPKLDWGSISYMGNFCKAYRLYLVVEGATQYWVVSIWPDTELLAPSEDGPHSLFPNRRSGLSTHSVCAFPVARAMPVYSIGEGAKAMRLFMFKSEGNRGLQAFAADPGGQQLPKRHGPWTAVGVVREDKAPPHNMSREMIEKSISDQGFQLYRMKQPQS